MDTGRTATVQYVHESPRPPGEGQGEGSWRVQYVRLTNTIYQNGRNVQYGYGTTDAIDDIMSRLKTITDNVQASVAYKYLGAGRIVEEDYVESQTKLSYLDSSGNVAGLDRFGRVADQIWTDYAADPDVAIDHYHYDYDRAGNRVSRDNVLKADHSLDETYQYDDLDRLVEWALGGTSQKTWTLDSLGNNVSPTTGGTYNAANEQETIVGSAVTPAYDRAGNMITLQSGKSAIYDAWNRMTKVSDASGILQQNVYDGRNRRIQIFSDFTGDAHATAQDDYYSGQQVIQSYTFTNDVFQGGYQYLWSPRYIDSLILRDTYNAGGTLVAADRLYYTNDANFNVTGLLKKVSDVWQPVERYTYTPYGDARYRNNAWADVGSSANANATLYTGRLWDFLTGLYYYRARFYDALLERFVNRDPIGYRGRDFNLYEYVRDDPLGGVDPTGLQTWQAYDPTNPLFRPGPAVPAKPAKLPWKPKPVIPFMPDAPSAYTDAEERQICKMKKVQELAGPDAWGATGCYDKRPFSCVFDDRIDAWTPNQKAREIIKACTRKHELFHRSALVCDECCDMGLRAAREMECYRGSSGECYAYAISEACLENALLSDFCGADQDCIKAIEKAFESKQQNRLYFCSLHDANQKALRAP